MKRFLVFTVFFVVPLVGCGKTYTFTTDDVYGAVGSTLGGKTTFRERALIIRNHTDIPLTIDFREETYRLGPGAKGVFSFRYTGLLADGERIMIPIMITAEDNMVDGIVRTWNVYRDRDSSEAWLIQRRGRKVIVDIDSSRGWF